MLVEKPNKLYDRITNRVYITMYNILRMQKGDPAGYTAYLLSEETIRYGGTNPRHIKLDARYARVPEVGL